MQLLTGSSESTDLCDHLVAYGQRGALISFYVAFQIEPLIGSDLIPGSEMDQFCELLGLSYKLQDRHAFYDWSKRGHDAYVGSLTHQP